MNKCRSVSPQPLQPTLNLKLTSRWFRNRAREFRITSSTAFMKGRDTLPTSTQRSEEKEKQNQHPNTGLKVQLLLPYCDTINLKIPKAEGLRRALVNGLKKKKASIKPNQRIVLVLRGGCLKEQILLNNAPEMVENSSVQFAMKVMTVSEKHSVSNYLYERVIGKGGFSKVVLARSVYDGCYYAIKAISKTFLKAKNYYSIVQNQLLLLKSLNHPNIVKFYSSFETEDFICLVMEYCPRGDLFSILRDKGQLDQQMVKFIACKVLEALAYLHQNQVMFRDLKPENILITANGGLKICDFGLSKYCPLDAESYTFCGSPCYLAPEMEQRRGHDHSLDLYCVGRLIFELLVGGLPKPDEQLDYPDYLSDEVVDLISKLIENRQQRARYFSDARLVLKHQWFVDCPLTSPFQYEPFEPIVGHHEVFIQLLSGQMREELESRYKQAPSQSQEWRSGLSFNSKELNESSQSTCVTARHILTKRMMVR